MYYISNNHTDTYIITMEKYYKGKVQVLMGAQELENFGFGR